MSQVEESRQNLWMLAVPPAIWAAHYLLIYIGTALWCGMPGPGRGSELAWMRWMVTVSAVVALGAVLLVGRRAWRSHTLGEASPPHDDDTPEDRHRFLGLATLLLSILSAIATVFVSVTVLFIPTCD